MTGISTIATEVDVRVWNRASTGVSRESVRKWRVRLLRPHVVETWKLSNDPEFIARVRDVVGLHVSRPKPRTANGHSTQEPAALSVY